MTEGDIQSAPAFEGIRPFPLFPVTFADIGPFAARLNLSSKESLERYIHLAVMYLLAKEPEFHEKLVLRGAGALLLFYGNRRLTSDLDLINLEGSSNPSEAESRAIESRIGQCLADGLPSMYPDSLHWRAFLQRQIQIHVSKPRGMLRFHSVPLIPTPDGVSIGVADIHLLISEKIAGILSKHWSSCSARWQDVADIAAMIRRFGNNLDIGAI